MIMEELGESQESATSELEQSNAEEAVDPSTSITDIDSLEKFKFQGRDWTPQELKSAYLMQSDYTRKTQALAEQQREWEQEKQYRDNLDVDLARVKKDPNLIGQFMQVYPRQYHKFLDFIAPTATNQMGSQQSNNQTQTDPAVFELQRQFAALQADANEKNVQAIQSSLDSKFQVLGKKYPYADEEAILARAESLLAQNPNYKFNDQVWEALWKSNNEKLEKAFKGHYSKLVKEQKTVSKRASDVPPGGAIPGRGPRLPKTIKEASNMLLESGELDNA